MEASNNIAQFPCGGPDFYCKEGSALPSLAHEGFYTATSGCDKLVLRNMDDMLARNVFRIKCVVSMCLCMYMHI